MAPAGPSDKDNVSVGSLLHFSPFKGSINMSIYNVQSQLSLSTSSSFFHSDFFSSWGSLVGRLGLSRYRLHICVALPPATAFAKGKPNSPCWSCPHPDSHHSLQRVPNGAGTVLGGEESAGTLTWGLKQMSDFD